MTTKAKLVSTIAAFCLVLALMVVGVLAATSATVQLGGSLSFTAKDVVATVKVSATGCTQTINGEGDYTHSFSSVDTDPASWTKEDINLTFSNKTTDIVITITIKNDAADRALTVTPTVPTVTSDQNVSITSVYSYDKTSDKTVTATELDVAAGQTVTYKITLHIMNPNNGVNSASTSWAAGFALANAD